VPDDDSAVDAQTLLYPRWITSVVLPPIQHDLDLAVASERPLQMGEEVGLIARDEDDPFGALG